MSLKEENAEVVRYQVSSAAAPPASGGRSMRDATRARCTARRMFTILGSLGLVTGMLASTASAAETSSGATGSRSVVGAVYVATNAWNGGNKILTFPRYADGSLGPVSAAVATGGRGSGPGQFAPIVNDPLGSQNSLITDKAGRYLFAVNAASNSIAAFKIKSRGLEAIGTVASNGDRPVSLAATNRVLYALNKNSNKQEIRYEKQRRFAKAVGSRVAAAARQGEGVDARA